MNTAIWLCTLALALLACWQWLRWKRRAGQVQQNLKAWKEALYALAFEVTNATNAARANLLDFRQVNTAVHMPEHLDQIQAATDRLTGILRIADDPVAWYRKKSASGA